MQWTSGCFILFFMAGLVVLRCFEFPVTEAEPRKGRELLAKRGEQKIRKNQVQAICHSLVAAWRIAGHRPRLPTHQQSLGTFWYKVYLKSCSSCAALFVLCVWGGAVRNGQIWWFGSTVFCSVPISNWKAQFDELFHSKFECSYAVPVVDMKRAKKKFEEKKET